MHPHAPRRAPHLILSMAAAPQVTALLDASRNDPLLAASDMCFFHTPDPRVA